LINKNVTAALSALAGYGKMMTGHVGIPKCVSAYILRFFLLCYHRVSMVFSVKKKKKKKKILKLQRIEIGK
jgi:hypothetical protein